MKKIIGLLALVVFSASLWGQDYTSKKDDKSGKWGYVDASDKWVISPKFDMALDFGNGYGTVKINDKQGIINKQGKLIIPCSYSYVHSNSEYSICSEGRYFQVTNENKKMGIYDIELKKEVVPCKYEYCTTMTDDRYFQVKSSDKSGVFDTNTGKEISPCIYEGIYVYQFKDNYLMVKKNSKYGIIDLTTGKETTPCKYDKVETVSENLVAVNIGGKWGYVDITNGKEVISPQYDEAQAFDNGVARVKKDGQLTLIKNPLKEGNAIAAAKTTTKKDPNAPAESRYPAPNSDVDKNIPAVKTDDNSALFAFIIANENYEEAPVPFALNDGRIFREYCQKTLGLPDKHIRMFEDASLGKIITAIEQIKERAKAYEGEASVILYYAGHGVPDEKKNTAYLLPVDGSGSDITTTGYSLAKLYDELSKLPLRSVTVFLDACFSGAKREDEMLASARGIATKVKDEAPKGNMVVFSAATGDETAHQYEEKGHGLFTYFLLKKLQETSGNVTYAELSDYVTKQVKRQSVVINDKRQTPTVIPSAALAEQWKNLKLK
ncbi:MAG: WG repeat-containing protein [Prevotellaceae bacterium]|nr:WG repeat-containing protein [Prevotellaceae bacterium]